MVRSSVFHTVDTPAALRHRTDQDDRDRITDLGDLVAVIAKIGTDLPSALSATVQTATAIENVCAASVVLRPSGGKPRTVVATNPWAESLDELQLHCTDSPYVNVDLKTAPVVHCADIGNPGRWHAFAEAAARTGLGSLMISDCSPAAAEGTRATTAWLNLYSLQRNLLGTRAQTLLTLLADIARFVIGLADATDSARQLQQAVASRDAIGCAKGVLMERHGLCEEAAFAHLRQTSNRHNMKLATVAMIIMNDPQCRLAG